MVLTFMTWVKRWRVFHARSVLGTDAPARRDFHILRSTTLHAVAGAAPTSPPGTPSAGIQPEARGTAKLGQVNSFKGA